MTLAKFFWALIFQASPAELAEYAVLLQKFGAPVEALKILSRVDKNQAPQAFPYEAFCHFPRWEFDLALKALESYISLIPDGYQNLVGRVNLASALLGAGRMTEASELLDENILLCQKYQHSRLEANCLEMRVQVHIRLGEFIAARKSLEKAEQLIPGKDTWDQLFVQKWKAILQSLSENEPFSIMKFRQEAIRREHWETVRETDLYLLKVKFNKKAFQHLVFGTPYKGYRERIYSENWLRCRRVILPSG